MYTPDHYTRIRRDDIELYGLTIVSYYEYLWAKRLTEGLRLKDILEVTPYFIPNDLDEE